MATSGSALANMITAKGNVNSGVPSVTPVAAPKVVAPVAPVTPTGTNAAGQAYNPTQAGNTGSTTSALATMKAANAATIAPAGSSMVNGVSTPTGSSGTDVYGADGKLVTNKPVSPLGDYITSATTPDWKVPVTGGTDASGKVISSVVDMGQSTGSGYRVTYADGTSTMVYPPAGWTPPVPVATGVTGVEGDWQTLKANSAQFSKDHGVPDPYAQYPTYGDYLAAQTNHGLQNVADSAANTATQNNIDQNKLTASTNQANSAIAGYTASNAQGANGVTGSANPLNTQGFTQRTQDAIASNTASVNLAITQRNQAQANLAFAQQNNQIDQVKMYEGQIEAAQKQIDERTLANQNLADAATKTAEGKAADLAKSFEFIAPAMSTMTPAEKTSAIQGLIQGTSMTMGEANLLITGYQMKADAQKIKDADAHNKAVDDAQKVLDSAATAGQTTQQKNLKVYQDLVKSPEFATMSQTDRDNMEKILGVPLPKVVKAAAAKGGGGGGGHVKVTAQAAKQQMAGLINDEVARTGNAYGHITPAAYSKGATYWTDVLGQPASTYDSQFATHRSPNEVYKLASGKSSDASTKKARPS